VSTNIHMRSETTYLNIQAKTQTAEVFRVVNGFAAFVIKHGIGGMRVWRRLQLTLSKC
jgi:hypothetical protein